jgi:hypothetical protein
MQEVFEFKLHGATVSIPAAQLIDNWIEKARQDSKVLAKPASITRRLGEFWPEAGGVYAGIMRGESGQPSYHLYHAPIEHEIAKTKWESAIEKAKTPINGFSDWSLPNRREARLLSINSPDSFDKDGWYWTSAQHAGNADYAWVQVFTDGDQSLYRKSNEYRARAVRRVLIIQ